MIKLPKEISQVVKAVEDAGHAIYMVGGSVRDSLLGMEPIDWDLATDATWQELVQILPEFQVLSEKYSVVRWEPEPHKEGEGLIIDIATFRREGEYSDHRRPDQVILAKSVEEDLNRRDFTINAMADSPTRGFVDPYGGREDLKNRKLKAVGNPGKRLMEDPSRMIRAIRMVSELELEMEPELYQAMVDHSGEMIHVAKEKILEELPRILTGPDAGKALRLLAGTNLMPYIIGEEIAFQMSRHELDDFSTYCDNIHRTKPIPLRRMGLFYQIFHGKRILQAATMLPHSKEHLIHFQDQMEFMDKVYFLRTKEELKRFIAKVGMERYMYLHNLSKAQRLVYDLPEDKIMAREIQMTDIKSNKEPIFVEDLAIDGNDLLQAGFEPGEGIGEMLSMLRDATLKSPQKNTKEDLLKLARIYKKSWIRRNTRNVKWMK
jgi:tRNA nucleotidyltransferase (CCA-adding enzyme)